MNAGDVLLNFNVNNVLKIEWFFYICIIKTLNMDNNYEISEMELREIYELLTKEQLINVLVTMYKDYKKLQREHIKPNVLNIENNVGNINM